MLDPLTEGETDTHVNYFIVSPIQAIYRRKKVYKALKFFCHPLSFSESTEDQALKNSLIMVTVFGRLFRIVAE